MYDPSLFEPKVLRLLRDAGWTQYRDKQSLVQEFQKVLFDTWISEANPFVRSFGDLTIANKLWVYPHSAAYQIHERDRVRNIVRCPCCPVAGSGFMGDGATLWIDVNDRFYVIDSEGMVFVGTGAPEALKVLLVSDGKCHPPPNELSDALAKAYEWNK